MHYQKHLLVGFIGLGLIACNPEKDPGEWEPYPTAEETPVLVCQEICDVDADCAAGTVCSGDCDPSEDIACDLPNVCVECKANDQCTDPLAPFCVLGGCAACADDSQCPATMPRCLDGTCTCNASLQCEPDERCMYTTDSARPSSVPGCVCWENSACAGIGPETCIAGICIECEFNAHCEASVGPGSECVDGGTLFAFCTCVNNADCTGVGCRDGVCDAVCDAGSCVECTADTNCPTSRPWCVGNSCVECRGEPREGTTETQDQVDTDCQTLGLGDTCVENSCSCSATDQCTADFITADNPSTDAVCQE